MPHDPYGPDQQRKTPASKKDGPSAPMRAMYALGGSGTEILASIVGLGLLGWAFDRWCGTQPWLLVTGLVLGTVGGVYNVVKKGRAFFENQDDDDRNT